MGEDFEIPKQMVATRGFSFGCKRENKKLRFLYAAKIRDLFVVAE
jgi:hypothetical protein